MDQFHGVGNLSSMEQMILENKENLDSQAIKSSMADGCMKKQKHNNSIEVRLPLTPTEVDAASWFLNVVFTTSFKNRSSIARCGHCKRLKPEYFKADELVRNDDPKISLAKIGPAWRSLLDNARERKLFYKITTEITELQDKLYSFKYTLYGLRFLMTIQFFADLLLFAETKRENSTANNVVEFCLEFKIEQQKLQELICISSTLLLKSCLVAILSPVR
ncbi:hypothetical protein GQX74_009573 [Glossina fuscipes]|nr:hypothetical protein GQX74_009573 [Glossina fuscipes]